MAKSVTLLKEALESDESSVKKYGEALNAMAHEQSKATIEGIIRSKKEHINSVKEILERSRECPAVQKEEN